MESMPIVESRRKQVVAKARERMSGRKLATIIVVALIHVGAVFALLRAFDIDVVPQAVKSIVSFDIALDPPAPEPEKIEEVEPEGMSGAAAPTAKAKEISAPPARVPKKESPPAPPVSNTGTETKSGAASGGTGTGAGGPGIATGSGGSGQGSGGDPFTRRAEKVSGEIRAKDYPRASASDRDGAYVIVHFTVTPDGSTRNCRVARSSGNPEVDRITCQLVVERFRYKPAVDANGNPTSEKVGWKQWWWR